MAVSIPKAGELNKRITLIRRTDKPLNEWEAQQTDEVIATLWAKIEPTGAMYWGTVQVEQKATHRFGFVLLKGKVMMYLLTMEYLSSIKIDSISLLE